jgi:hypothetical protein
MNEQSQTCLLPRKRIIGKCDPELWFYCYTIMPERVYSNPSQFSYFKGVDTFTYGSITPFMKSWLWMIWNVHHKCTRHAYLSFLIPNLAFQRSGSMQPSSMSEGEIFNRHESFLERRLECVGRKRSLQSILHLNWHWEKSIGVGIYTQTILSKCRTIAKPGQSMQN